MKPESIEKQLMTLDEDEKELLDSIENDEWIPNYETSEQFERRKTELMEAVREEVVIPCRSGETFAITPKALSLKSPFDIPGLNTDITRNEIIDAIRESRASSQYCEPLSD